MDGWVRISPFHPLLFQPLSMNVYTKLVLFVLAVSASVAAGPVPQGEIVQKIHLRLA